MHEIGHRLFEVSTEVANKGACIIQLALLVVGGIYTVLRSKAFSTVREYGEKNYFLIGPKTFRTSLLEIEQFDFDCDVQEVVNSMKKCGLDIITGRWLVEGGPLVILFGSEHGVEEYQLLEDFYSLTGIKISQHDHELKSSLRFGYHVLQFAQNVCSCFLL
jgi:glycogen(starch) synthase